MTVDFLLLGIMGVNLYVLGTGRLSACVRAMAVQGCLLALLPPILFPPPAAEAAAEWLHVAALAAGTFFIKVVGIPRLLLRVLEDTGVRRDAEPYVSLHLSLLAGALLSGLGFWLGSVLRLPGPEAQPPLVVPAAFATLFVGFFVLVSRTKAVTQVIGYLMLENGVQLFGQALLPTASFVLELGILLDLLVGVFLMAITIFHIRREFDGIDTDFLSNLRD